MWANMKSTASLHIITATTGTIGHSITAEQVLLLHLRSFLEQWKLVQAFIVNGYTNLDVAGAKKTTGLAPQPSCSGESQDPGCAVSPTGLTKSLTVDRHDVHAEWQGGDRVLTDAATMSHSVYSRNEYAM